MNWPERVAGSANHSSAQSQGSSSSSSSAKSTMTPAASRHVAPQVSNDAVRKRIAENRLRAEQLWKRSKLSETVLTSPAPQRLTPVAEPVLVTAAADPFREESRVPVEAIPIDSRRHYPFQNVIIPNVYCHIPSSISQGATASTTAGSRPIITNAVSILVIDCHGFVSMPNNIVDSTVVSPSPIAQSAAVCVNLETPNSPLRTSSTSSVRSISLTPTAAEVYGSPASRPTAAASRGSVSSMHVSPRTLNLGDERESVMHSSQSSGASINSQSSQSGARTAAEVYGGSGSAINASASFMPPATHRVEYERWSQSPVRNEQSSSASSSLGPAINRTLSAAEVYGLPPSFSSSRSIPDIQIHSTSAPRVGNVSVCGGKLPVPVASSVHASPQAQALSSSWCNSQSSGASTSSVRSISLTPTAAEVYGSPASRGSVSSVHVSPRTRNLGDERVSVMHSSQSSGASTNSQSSQSGARTATERPQLALTLSSSQLATASASSALQVPPVQTVTEQECPICLGTLSFAHNLKCGCSACYSCLHAFFGGDNNLRKPCPCCRAECTLVECNHIRLMDNMIQQMLVGESRTQWEQRLSEGKAMKLRQSTPAVAPNVTPIRTPAQEYHDEEFINGSYSPESDYSDDTDDSYGYDDYDDYY